jgi:hypothetical protein
MKRGLKIDALQDGVIQSEADDLATLVIIHAALHGLFTSVANSRGMVPSLLYLLELV